LFTKICKTKQAWFLPFIPSFLLFIRSKKRQPMLFNVLQNESGVLFPVMCVNFANISFGKGANN
jgi:hypothetical protein